MSQPLKLVSELKDVTVCRSCSKPTHLVLNTRKGSKPLCVACIKKATQNENLRGANYSSNARFGPKDKPAKILSKTERMALQREARDFSTKYRERKQLAKKARDAQNFLRQNEIKEQNALSRGKDFKKKRGVGGSEPSPYGLGFPFDSGIG